MLSPGDWHTQTEADGELGTIFPVNAHNNYSLPSPSPTTKSHSSVDNGDKTKLTQEAMERMIANAANMTDWAGRVVRRELTKHMQQTNPQVLEQMQAQKRKQFEDRRLSNINSSTTTVTSAATTSSVPSNSISFKYEIKKETETEINMRNDTQSVNSKEKKNGSGSGRKREREKKESEMEEQAQDESTTAVAMAVNESSGLLVKDNVQTELSFGSDREADDIHDNDDNSKNDYSVDLHQDTIPSELIDANSGNKENDADRVGRAHAGIGADVQSPVAEENNSFIKSNSFGSNIVNETDIKEVITPVPVHFLAPNHTNDTTSSAIPDPESDSALTYAHALETEEADDDKELKEAIALSMVEQEPEQEQEQDGYKASELSTTTIDDHGVKGHQGKRH